MPQNALYLGDNLQILRNDIRDESIDLVYLDPPFNSNRPILPFAVILPSAVAPSVRALDPLNDFVQLKRP